MKNLRSMLPNEIEDILAGLGEPKYRAKQVFKWLGRGIGSIDEMSDIPKSLREKLKTEYTVYEPKVLSKQVSKIDGTIKYLWELYDGNAVETVVMSYKHGNTVCVSTQVGCRQGCAFCASTIGALSDASSRTKFSRRSCFRRSIRGSRYQISSSWASASRLITSITLSSSLNL